MKAMMTAVGFGIAIICFSSHLRAQNQDVHHECNTALFVELGGKWLASVNIDFAINKTNRYSIGISPVEPDIVPTIMYYNLRGENSRFEIGCGLGYVIILDTEIEREKFKGVTLHGVLGYRYQKKNGLLFRAGFTPILYSDVFLPWAGVSLGYCM
ncbi:hypothetical protein ACFL6E_07900 [Candidatus Neomarinimicrobiota bacterium]